MAEFKDTMLTKKGRTLLAKAMAGATLNFTKLQAGAGVLEGNSDGLTKLITPKLDGQIISVDTIGNGGCFIKGRLSNTGLAESFRMCEIGVFANDPDLGEILYCYTNIQDPDKADYMGADTGNPNGLLEEEITIGAYISNAANVTANIVKSSWATEIGYDNTQSKLQAIEVQSAIDELTVKYSDIYDQMDNKVNVVAGKGLSSNDYTSDEKTKLAGIATGANKTVVENVLTSTSTTNALSAAQGKLLNENKINKSDFVFSNASNGYIKFPNGLTIQWGLTVIQPGVWGSITLPVTFSKIFTAQATCENIDGQDKYAYLGQLTTSTLSVKHTNNIIRTVHWIAIGYITP